MNKAVLSIFIVLFFSLFNNSYAADFLIISKTPSELKEMVDKLTVSNYQNYNYDYDEKEFAYVIVTVRIINNDAEIRRIKHAVARGLPANTTLEDIGRYDAEISRIKHAVARGLPANATLKEITDLDGENERKRLINTLGLSADATWTEIDRANRAEK